MARLGLFAAFLATASLVPAHESADYQFSGNDVINNIVGATVPAPNLPGGWYESEQCVSGYCIYANPTAAGGSGVVTITSSSSFEKMKVMERGIGAPDRSEIPDPPPYEIKEVPGKGKVLVATETIKRGTRLLSNEPALIVHRGFFNETFPEKQEPLLEAAVKLLPVETQKRIYGQIDPANNILTLKDVVNRRPFEANLGLTWVGRQGYEEEKHLINFPGAEPLQHDCRPNAAFHIDMPLVHEVTAVRKIEPGEEISISYFNPFLPTADRQNNVRHWLGKPCACDACTKGGNLEQVLASDRRLEEIRDIQNKLRDWDARVTTGMLARLIELYQEERLESRLADMYGQVAINYNSLGYQKRAIKYAEKAVQAGIIESGKGSNDVIAMRILAKNTLEHYSWRKRLQDRG
ncbi:hypothetical protein VUR80DRAFT_1768 [Thermomyces stellatus]